MTRLAVVVAAAVMGVSFVVAMVRAQDGRTSEPGLFPISDQVAQGTGATTNGEISVLVRSTKRGVTDSNASNAPARTAPASRPSAAERLKQIRESSPRAGSAAEGITAGRTVIGPVTSNPAELSRQPDSAPSAADSFSSRGDSGSSSDSSVLKGSSAGPSSERATARRLLRTPARSSPSTLPFSGTASGATGSDASHEGVQAPTLADGPSPAAQPETATAPPQRSTADGAILTSQGPALRVETSGPRSLMVGKEATYTVQLHNEGDSPASNVLLRVGLPAFVRVVAEGASSDTAGAAAGSPEQLFVWTIPQVPARGTQRVTLQVVPTENKPIQLSVDWTTRPTSATAQIEVLQPQLRIEVFGPRDVLFGDMAVYTIRISNPGTGDAEEVAVEFGYGDQRLGPKRVGSLAAGQQTELKVELNAREAGPIEVIAAVSAAGGLQVDARQEVQVRRARLEVEVVGDPVVFAGSVVGYRIVVRNSGDAPVGEVVAAVTLPAGSKLLSRDGWDSGASGLQTPIGTLPPGGERSLTLQCSLANSGDNPLAVRVAGAHQQEASSSFVTRVEALPDLKLTINDPSGPVPVNQETVYELHIVNRGTKAAAKVNVVAQFSDGIEPVSVTGANGQIVPGQVVFEPIPRIEAGQELTLIVKARADSEGTKRFRVEVNSDASETQLVAQETTYFYRDTRRAATGK